MANVKHLAILKQGVDVWNKWRRENLEVRPDLRKADLGRRDLHKADFNHADLRGADLRHSNLCKANLLLANLTKAELGEADLSEADLSGAKLNYANLDWADLSNAILENGNFRKASFIGAKLKGAELRAADLRGADLTKAILNRTDLCEANFSSAKLIDARLSESNLRRTNFRKADLSGSDLSYARLIETDFTGATLAYCWIYGISAWGLKLENTTQSSLIISGDGKPQIVVEDLEVAQFIYLLFDNRKIRNFIKVATSRIVLILGRFRPKRYKDVLDAIRDTLSKPGFSYIPIMFDFENDPNRNYRDTVKTLALLSRFIIADITEAKIVIEELEAIAPIGVPIQPILQRSHKEFSTFFEDFRENFCDRVLKVYRYKDVNSLLASLADEVIAPAEAKAKELEKRRQRDLR